MLMGMLVTFSLFIPIGLNSNNAGEFTFPAVQPGQYSVKVEQQGFKAYQRKGMNLAANDVFSLGEIKLDVGAVTESVLVETQGSVVATNSSEHSALLTANQTFTTSAFSKGDKTVYLSAIKK